MTSCYTALEFCSPFIQGVQCCVADDSFHRLVYVSSVVSIYAVVNTYLCYATNVVLQIVIPCVCICWIRYLCWVKVVGNIVLHKLLLSLYITRIFWLHKSKWLLCSAYTFCVGIMFVIFSSIAIQREIDQLNNGK